MQRKSSKKKKDKGIVNSRHSNDALKFTCQYYTNVNESYGDDHFNYGEHVLEYG